MSRIDDDSRDPPAADTAARGSDRGTVSPRGQVVRGIAAAFACDTGLTVALTATLPLIRPENVQSAVANLALGLNMLVGYVGGRASARAGLAHDDGRSQWLMACAVSVLSVMAAIGLQYGITALHLDAWWPHDDHAAQGSASPNRWFLQFVVALLLVRFGFAMGTYSQAKREGRVRDEDEASAE